jgi:hypothetical protein
LGETLAAAATAPAAAFDRRVDEGLERGDVRADAVDGAVLVAVGGDAADVPGTVAIDEGGAAGVAVAGTRGGLCVRDLRGDRGAAGTAVDRATEAAEGAVVLELDAELGLGGVAVAETGEIEVERRGDVGLREVEAAGQRGQRGARARRR